MVGTADLFAGSRELAIAAGLTTPDRCFSSVEEAIEATDPEAVLVTASLVGHVPAAVAALELGTARAGREAVRPERRRGQGAGRPGRRSSGLTVAVSQNYRFFPAVQTVRKLVADRELGDLHAVELDFRQFSGTGGIAGPTTPWPSRCSWTCPSTTSTCCGTCWAARSPPISCRTWDPGVVAVHRTVGGGGADRLRTDLVASYRASWVSSGARTAWAGEWRMDFAGGEVWWTSRGDGPEGWRSDLVTVRRGRILETLSSRGGARRPGRQPDRVRSTAIAERAGAGDLRAGTTSAAWPPPTPPSRRRRPGRGATSPTGSDRRADR